MTKTNEIFLPLSEFEALQPDWLWEPYIAFGMITIMEGDPGLGKTFVANYIASTMTVGDKLPNGARLTKQDVAFISYEDDPGYTLRPRCDASGGDARRIHVLDDDFTLDNDGFDRLDALISEHDIGLVVIDPFVAAIPSGKDMFRSNAIRPILSELSRMAAAHECAFVLIRHLTKAKHDKAIYQGGGSMDYIGAARSAIRVDKHPNNDAQRVLVHIKCNIGPKGRSWAFELVDQGKGQIPLLGWLGECDITDDDLVGESNEGRVEEAMSFLRRELRHKPRPVAELDRIAQDEGISPRTMKRARSELGVKPYQTKRQWYLPRIKPKNTSSR